MNRDIVLALEELLDRQGGRTQDELRLSLIKKGHHVNQSTISRYLKKLGAVRFLNEDGKPNYRLPEESLAPPPPTTRLADLVLNISHNNAMIVIKTSPGSASLVARHLDHYRPGGILGTIAGDDTIFVAPANSSSIQKVIVEIEKSIP